MLKGRFRLRYRSAFRQITRAQAALEREHRAAQRAVLALEKAQLRAQAAAEKADRQAYVESRIELADAMTAAVHEQEDELRHILVNLDQRSCALDFSSLTRRADYPVFDAQGYDENTTTPCADDFTPPPLGVLQKLIPGAQARHAEAIAAGVRRFNEALSKHAAEEGERALKLASLQRKYEETCAKIRVEIERHNSEVDDLRRGYESHDPAAVVEYFKLVIAKAQPFEDAALSTRVAYTPESKQLVIQYEMPDQKCVPPECGYRYVKKSDSIAPLSRKASEVKALYREAICQLVCRVLKLIAYSDVASAVDIVVVNGYVNTIDPANGRAIAPTIVSVRASRVELEKIDFNRVEASACLMNLRASVTRSAHELEPVRPIVDFNMVDSRFVDKDDILTSLDTRPNIAELTPSEFENLMTNLFEKMGLETRLTQASRDGGVDCVAWDMRPVIGGKVIIQAKRYKNTVGVSAVRDLFGTMMNEGAAKGILVTTSGFGQSAYEFAKSKPIELVTGSNLLAMLSDYAGVAAKIEFPQEWQDQNNALL